MNNAYLGTVFVIEWVSKQGLESKTQVMANSLMEAENHIRDLERCHRIIRAYSTSIHIMNNWRHH